MTQYVQYDVTGRITGVVVNYVAAPEFLRQLAFDPPVEVRGKKVDLGTLELVDIAP